MKTINYRFLNYKNYDRFKQDLATSDKIREGDIVFIQDALRIWARGNEYVCDGPSATRIDSDTLTFKNGVDNTVMTIRSADGTITFTDSDGRTLQTTFALNSNFREEINRLSILIQNNWDNLATVAKTGLYSDLIDKPNPVVIDSNLSDSSKNPVQNKVIYDALRSKADSSTFDLYVQKNLYEQGMKGKQDKLTAGHGIDITNNKISSILDTNLYTIVTERPDPESANPDKIYLLEIQNVDGTYRYEQYRLRNGQWILIGNTTTNVDLSPYLKSTDAVNLYQPKRNDYVITSNLQLYTPLAAFKDLQQSLNDYVQYTYLQKNYQPKGNYALESWVDANFVKKVDIYTPLYESSIIPENSGSSSSSGSSGNNIIVDSALNINSHNPVRNSVVTAALQGKQDVLTAGNGISIFNNVIELSTTPDTTLFIITDDLNSVSPNENKIYLLRTVENGETVYAEYKWINNEWVYIGSKNVDVNLTGYAKSSDLERYATHEDLNAYTLYSEFEEYKTWADNTYSKSQVIIPPGGSNITVDSELDITSSNPVENNVITRALRGKVDNSTLNDYATKDDLSSKIDASDLDDYVSTIIDNVINSTLDTDVFVIVDSRPSSGDPNKIYLVETIQNNQTIYVGWRYRNGEWIEIGQKDPGINLDPYLTKSEASATYITENTADDRYQPKGQYVAQDELDTLRLYIQNTYAKKRNYVLAEDVATALVVLQQIIDQKYVLKRDVYRPNEASEWSTADPTTISVGGSNGGSSGGTGANSNMVTLSQQEYQSLVDNNMIDETTYYFTYEGEEITTNWTFGGTFPIILSGPEGLGTFPIELT